MLFIVCCSLRCLATGLSIAATQLTTQMSDSTCMQSLSLLSHDHATRACFADRDKHEWSGESKILKSTMMSCYNVRSSVTCLSILSVKGSVNYSVAQLGCFVKLIWDHSESLHHNGQKEFINRKDHSEWAGAEGLMCISTFPGPLHDSQVSTFCFSLIVGLSVKNSINCLQPC